MFTRLGTALAASSWLFIAFPAVAMSSASPEQVLCANTYIVEATVSASEVRPLNASGLVYISAKVTDMLGIKDIVKEFPSDVGVDSNKTIEVVISDSFFTGRVLPESSRDNYIGQKFIFGILIRYGDIWESTTDRDAQGRTIGKIVRNHQCAAVLGKGISSRQKRLDNGSDC